jgi:hypothetical protein
MNVVLATANQVGDGKKGLKQRLLVMDRAIKKYLFTEHSRANVVPDNLGVWVRGKHTPYVTVCRSIVYTKYSMRY